MIRIGFGGRSTIIIIRSPQNGTGIIKAPILGVGSVSPHSFTTRLRLAAAASKSLDLLGPEAADKNRICAGFRVQGSRNLNLEPKRFRLCGAFVVTVSAPCPHGPFGISDSIPFLAPP